MDIDLKLTLNRLIDENKGIASPIYLENEEFCDLLNNGVKYKDLNNKITLQNNFGFYHELAYNSVKFLTFSQMEINDL